MTQYYNSKQHDMGITDPSTADVVGMMLLKVSSLDAKHEVPAWAEYDDQYLATQFFTSQPSYVNTPPERRLAQLRTNWRDSFGKETYSDDEPSRYFASYGMDLSNDGMAVAGPISTAVTLPTITATNEANLDWETWTNSTTPGTWTEDQALTQSATAHGGSSSATITTTGATWAIVAHQHITWNTEYRSRTFHLRGWGRSSKNYAGADYAVKFAIYDGQTRTYSGVCGNTAANTWSQSTWASKTLASNASELTIEVYVKDNGEGWAYLWDDMEFVDPTVGTIPAYGHADFNGSMYFAYGNNLCMMNSSGVVSYVASLPATITCLEPFTDSKLYIALGYSYAYWEMTTGGVFTINTLSANAFKYFKCVRGATPIMWGNDSDYTIKYNSDPSDGGTHAWSAATTTGSSDHDITGLYDHNGALYIGWTQYPLYLNSSSAVQNDKAPELAAITSSTSGKNADIWQDKWYYPAGAQALLEIGTANTYRNPSSYCTNLSDFIGTVQAVTHDESWLFVILDNSTKVEILKGGNVLVDGTSTWVWHPFHELTLAGCETAWVSSVYQKRLWISSTANSILYYIPLPTGYGAVTSDANRTFLTGTYFEDSYIHYNFQTDYKTYYKITVVLGHDYDANIYFNVYYKKLGDSGYTLIGAFKGTSTNRAPSAYVPVDGSGYNPISPMMKFKFEAVTNDTQKTPILLSYTPEALLYPPTGKIFTAKIRTGKSVANKIGVIEPNVDLLIQTALDNARTATYPVTINDLEGTSRTVKFLPLPSDIQRRVPLTEQDNEVIEWVYNVMMQEVVVSGTGTSPDLNTGYYPTTRQATQTVTASDALVSSRGQTDSLTDGTADEVDINAAEAALPT